MAWPILLIARSFGTARRPAAPVGVSTMAGRPLAAEVLVDGEATRVVRRRQTVAELLALELDA